MSRLIRLYPRRWRERYEEEFASLLAEQPAGIADVIDIIRGALDARLHPMLGDDTRPIPWPHRMPGLFAASAGLTLTVAGTTIAARSEPGWGPAADLFGIAFVLMLISLPGDYLAPFGRKIAAVLGLVVLGGALAPMTQWAQAGVVVAVIAELAALCGLLAMAGIRAGLGARWRWLGLAFAFLVPALALGALALVRAITGAPIVPDGSRILMVAVVPYGLAWLAIGARTAIRGSATFTDAPTPAPTPEVPA